MPANELSPLKISSLSNEVIGSVKLRGWPRRHSVREEETPSDDGNDRFLGSRKTTTFASKRTQPSSVSVNTFISQATSKPKPHSTKLYSGMKSPSAEMDDQAVDLEHLVLSSLEYHRERCRKPQQRYRMRQRKSFEALVKEIQSLQDEVQSLQEHRDRLGFDTQTNESVWAVVAEYFRVFRFGFLDLDRASEDLSYLHATMAPGMDIVNANGFPALVRNWATFSQYFHEVNFHVKSLQLLTENLLVATTTTSVTISRNSLRYIFPHLSSGGNCETGVHGTRIGAKLLGQRLVVRGTVRFYWDNTKNRVVGLYSQADMVSPLLELLGTLEDVSRVFAKALITPDCNLVVAK